jgi:protein transport protein SEC13
VVRVLRRADAPDDDSWLRTNIEDCPRGVNAVSWAPHGHLGHQEGTETVLRLATAGCDGAVRVYRRFFQATEWTLEAVLRGEEGHKEWVRDVAWAPVTGGASNLLASCSDDKTTLLWRQVAVGGPWTAEPLPKFEAPVWRVSWSITGNLLAVSRVVVMTPQVSSGDSNVSLWKQALSGAWEVVSHVPTDA